MENWSLENLERLKMMITLDNNLTNQLVNADLLGLFNEMKIDLSEDKKDVHVMIEAINDKLLEENPDMNVYFKNTNKLEIFSYKKLYEVLALEGEDHIEYWPTHFTTRKEYLAWVSQIEVS